MGGDNNLGRGSCQPRTYIGDSHHYGYLRCVIFRLRENRRGNQNQNGEQAQKKALIGSDKTSHLVVNKNFIEE